jgi:hypothetical protein
MILRLDFLRVPGVDLRSISWLMERISLRMDSASLLAAISTPVRIVFSAVQGNGFAAFAHLLFVEIVDP